MRCASGVGEVERDRAFAAVDGEVVAGLAGVAAVLVLEKRRAPAAGVIARAWALDLHDVGAEIGEDLPGPWPRQDPAQVEDTDMRQRPGHFSTSPSDDSAMHRTERRSTLSPLVRAKAGTQPLTQMKGRPGFPLARE